MVPEEGVEPTLPKRKRDFESRASASSATPAGSLRVSDYGADSGLAKAIARDSAAFLRVNSCRNAGSWNFVGLTRFHDCPLGCSRALAQRWPETQSVMAKTILTDPFVRSVKTPGKFFDQKTIGLVLRVRNSGAKSWAFVYRQNGQKAQWLKLGTYPALTLVRAREEAYKHRAVIEVEKRDPVAEAKAAKAIAAQPQPRVFTFADMVGVYLAFAKGVKKTWDEDERKCNKHLIPAWGERPLRSISRGDVNELLNRLQAGGMTVGCNRIRALIHRIFRVGIDRELVDANPAAGVLKRAKEQPRTRVLSDEEIRSLWASLAEHDGAAADAIRLRLLTGQRGGEVMDMQRDQIDLIKGIWAIPPARAKNGQAHIVPLSPSAKAIIQRRLEEIPQHENHVFGNLNVRSKSITQLAPHDGDYDWRDLRRTVATRLAEMGVEETTIGRVLNHKRTTVTAKHYNQHAYTNEKRRALTLWDEALREIVTGEARITAAVVPMTRTA